MRIRDLANPGSGMETAGSGINIPDAQHCIKIIGNDVTAAKINHTKWQNIKCYLLPLDKLLHN
jgi:hypothetical protein